MKASLAERLQQALDRKGWLPARLASEVGIERATVGRWLSGERGKKSKGLHGDMLFKVADALGVQAAWLQGVSDEWLPGIKAPDMRDRPPAELAAAFPKRWSAADVALALVPFLKKERPASWWQAFDDAKAKRRDERRKKSATKRHNHVGATSRAPD